MKIELIDLKNNNNLESYKEVLQDIIEANLVKNDGTLIRGDILSKDFKWSHLYLLMDSNKVVGFALVRESTYDQHNTGYDSYYYISDIAIAPQYQNKGLGTKLLKYVTSSIDDLPIVASVRKDNTVSMNLFSRNMEKYEETDGYSRFINRKKEKNIRENLWTNTLI